jgi:hypothetical protein
MTVKGRGKMHTYLVEKPDTPSGPEAVQFNPRQAPAAGSVREESTLMDDCAMI